MELNKRFRFILKVPKKILPLVEINGNLTELPDFPPRLRRTSRGIDGDIYEPSNSINYLCESIPNDINELCNIKVFRYGYWNDVEWKINRFTNQIYYWATSYFNPPYLYKDNIGEDYILCRPQYNVVTFYFIMKLKIYGIRKIKERYIKKKFNQNLKNRIRQYVY